MKLYKNQSIRAFLDDLSARTPVPGGGAAAALTAGLGAALISMVAQYSLKKGRPKAVEQKIKAILTKSEKIRKRLLDLVDRDAQAYLNVVRARSLSAARKKAALKGARTVPLEVEKLCYEAVNLSPYLVREGNRYLVSDIRVAVELLLAAFYAAKINVEINQ